MKKNRKIIIAFDCVLCALLLGGMICGWQIVHADHYRLEVIQVGDDGYGYRIFQYDRPVIVQPFIPALPGKETFRTKQDARKVGNLVLKRVKAGEDCSVSKEDLKKEGIY